MNEAVREMTFEEEYEILKRESEKVFAKENGCEAPFVNFVLGRALRCIRKLQEQQPKADWIPIEKELPKKHDDYFVTVKKISNGKVEYFTAIDTFEPQTKQWYMNIDIPNLEREVIAWQPKVYPKPYERMTEREGECSYEVQLPRSKQYICKKTALICRAENLKYCKHKQPYKKEGAENGIL